MFVVVIALQSLSDGLQALFAFCTPAFLVWWRERRHAEKIENQRTLSEVAVYPDTPPSHTQIAAPIAPGYSRTSELREKLFGDSLPEYARDKPVGLGNAMASITPPKPDTRPVIQSKTPQGWVPRGQSVVIGGREIDGMIYVGTPPQVGSYGYGEKCRAYIDPTLSVASSGSDKRGDGMSYWPGYSSIPSVCRATYLDWLAEGRSDGSVNPGYMFLFFYGLERRFLIDQPEEEEKREILAEVARLKAIFGQNHSVQRYLGEFIELARIGMFGTVSLEDAALRQSILDNRSWDVPLSLKVALGGAIANGEPLSADWLYVWFMCHFEKRLRTPAQRCEQEFRELFNLKFGERYPQGMQVRKPRKKLEYNYRAASGEFGGNVSLEANGQSILDIAGLHKPIEIGQEIADEAMDELDKFSRFLGRCPDGRGSIEAHALLPTTLWSAFPSTEMEDLKAWARAIVAAGGLVPAVDAITRLEGAGPEKVGKRQLTGAADALARLGFGMAPDPRFSLRGPKIDEPVVIFEIGETVEQLENVSAAYRTILFEIALATFIAHADGQIVEAERIALQRKIAESQGINDLERNRLNANLDWYLAVPPDMSLLRGKLKEADAEHHMALRAAVVAIAHADNVIQSEEVASIEKVYKALGLDPALVYSDLHAGDVSDRPVRVKQPEPDAPGEKIPEEVAMKSAPLDAARIAAIRSDTARVSTVLGDIFSSDDEADEETKHVAPSILSGLDSKHALLVEDIVRRGHWSEAEFTDLTRKHGLMASGALEVINEWAFDKFEEALLDEYEGYDVAPDIAEVLTSEFAKEIQQ